jgi:hypothetical protein
MMKRIHIVGVSARTGTTLLAECMINCFRIDAFDEHETPLTRHRRGEGIYLTKNPGDLWAVGPRLAIDPHLHVIVMLRDPRDVIVSRHQRSPERYWAPLGFWLDRYRYVKTLTGRPRFILVRYEDLVREPDSIQRMLHKRLPFLTEVARFSEFHRLSSPSFRAREALGGVRPIDIASIGRWRQHRARVAGQLQQHEPIVRQLIELGYERDEAWLKELAEVEPDASPSFWPNERFRRNWRTDVRRAALAYLEAAKIAAARLLGVRLL